MFQVNKNKIKIKEHMQRPWEGCAGKWEKREGPGEEEGGRER